MGLTKFNLLFNHSRLIIHSSNPVFECFLKLPNWSEHSFETGTGLKEKLLITKLMFIYLFILEGDLWAVCSRPTFNFNDPNCFYALLQSVSHGPSKSGLIVMSPIDSISHISKLRSGLFAVHLLNINTQLMVIQTLRNLRECKSPLLPPLAGVDCSSSSQRYARLLKTEDSKTVLKTSLPWETIEGFAKDVISRFCLNEDQEKVIWRCASWLVSDQPSDIRDIRDQNCVLVHGVFGSGKSYLLVALVIFFVKCAQNDVSLSHLKIFICAVTNVAGEFNRV
jgi:hypothetical protein